MTNDEHTRATELSLGRMIASTLSRNLTARLSDAECQRVGEAVFREIAGTFDAYRKAKTGTEAAPTIDPSSIYARRAAQVRGDSPTDRDAAPGFDDESVARVYARRRQQAGSPA